MNFIVLLFLVINSFNVEGQSLDKGFQYLDSGDYPTAINFFSSYLKDNPNSKTAKICLGRALGLGGSPEEALTMFLEMEQQFPSDIEVLLNKGEALLWNSEGAEAIGVYQEILGLDPQNFTAHLGMANAYASTRNYSLAQKYIDGALAIDPDNQGAKVSYKFIRLGAAADYITKQEFQQASMILDSLILDYPEDKDVVLALLQLNINSGEISTAREVYEKYDSIFSNDQQFLLQGSLVYHLDNQEIESQRIASDLYDNVDIDPDSNISSQIRERYGQILLWNKDFIRFQSYLDENKIYASDLWYIGLQAMYHDLRFDPGNALMLYKVIVAQDSTSFSGLLGGANASLALDQPREASQFMNKAYKEYGNQKDILGIRRKLKYTYSPSIATSAARLVDSGDNIAEIVRVNARLPFGFRFQLLADYSGRFTDQTNLSTEAQVQSIGLGVRYKWKPHMYTSVKIVPTRLSDRDGSQSQLLGEVKLEYKPRLLDQLEVRLYNAILDYNTSLINASISELSANLSYNLFTRKNFGWYNQVVYSRFSDDNNRSIWYSSLYYQWKAVPIIKTGLSFQMLSFSVSRPNIYFSPTLFTSQEIFAEIFQQVDPSKSIQWIYRMLVAGGLQQIEGIDNQVTFRSYLSVGRKFNESISASIYGQWSNVASAVASGFSFYQVGLQVNYHMPKGVFNIFDHSESLEQVESFH